MADSVATQSPKRLILTRWTMPPTVKRREIRCRPHPAGGALRNGMHSIFLFFLYQQRLFYSIVPQSCFAAITYQIKHYFDFSNCKFTRSFLISAIWRGSPCRRSSDDANTDWVHYLHRLCCLRSRANVGATLGVRPRPWQRMPTLWQCRPTSHC